MAKSRIIGLLLLFHTAIWVGSLIDLHDNLKCTMLGVGCFTLLAVS